MVGNKILPKFCHKFYCDKCDYGTSKKSSYNDHLISRKHNKSIIGNENLPKICSDYICQNCNKIYKDNSGLWRHKKTCNQHLNHDLVNEEEDKQQLLIDYLLKENSEFKQLMIEQNKQMMDQNKGMIELAKNSGNNNNNTNNNNFNLQFFLNDTCKDAMNIMDFVSQLQVGITDLEETGRLGFAEGISKIFIKGLQQINVNDRPIHCSDSKRETLYIKTNNEWAKQNEDKIVLTNAIKHVAHKNIKQITEWTKEHPHFSDPDSKENDRYLQIVTGSISGTTKEQTDKNYHKIIKNIVKESIIDK